MDEVFGLDNFINEIVWCYKTFGVGDRTFAKKHDTILLYAKNANKYTFNMLKEKSYNRGFKKYGFKGGKYEVKEYEDEKGWYTIVNMKDWWIDVSGIFKDSPEKTNYPTQKPEALIERMIMASSNEGDVVADFFMGSGTTQAVAQKLGRKWIGYDINIGALQTATKRLNQIIADQRKRNKGLQRFSRFQDTQCERLRCLQNEIEAKKS